MVKFVDEGIFTLIEKRDSSYLEYDRTYRIDMLREVIVIDTLGTVPVKDSLFSNTDRYKNMAYITIQGVQDSMFKINAEVINKNGYNKYFLLDGKRMNVENFSFDDAEIKKATPSEFKRLFGKSMQSRLVSRVVLNKFIKEVA